ncbi:MAG: DUF362 domain-containing protein [Sedimentisphaerales bacterium]|jgi:uncharacterized protein (DUF362 family)
MVATDETRVGLAIIDKDAFGTSSPYRDAALLSRLLKEAMSQGGLGRKNPDIPLADIIEPGMSVLLKPNWVLHYNQSGCGMDCMVTHPFFIKAVLKEIFAAKPSRVIIGDAPIHDAVFEELLSLDWLKTSDTNNSCPVEIIDFRRCIVDKCHRFDFDKRGLEHYILFDLGHDSLLEPISGPKENFRVTNYDPHELASTHRPGRHQYLLAKEPFEADVIINLPKLKAHKKAGITAAVKNLVGINGNKDYLPHHRIGGSAQGGDCYEGSFFLKRLAESFLDIANNRINRPDYSFWHLCAIGASRLQRAIHPHVNKALDGSWYGNDTVWRMVLDLNRIAMYGKIDGSMSSTPVRRVYSLTDGIVAGQHNGPLAPEPINMGAVTFACSSLFADMAHAALMHFDWRKIALLRCGLESDYKYPLVRHPAEELKVCTNGKTHSFAETARLYGKDFIPPDGWKEHIELRG